MLFPLFLIILGIVQFGFIFNTYVTMTNATREAARSGTVYICSQSTLGVSNWTQAQCDLARNNAIKSALTSSMNLLSTTAPQFSVGSTWTQSGTTFTNGDLTISYCRPTTTSAVCPATTDVTDSTARTGYQVQVTGAYHLDLVVPLISSFLPKDSGGRLRLTGDVTMVIN